MGLFVPSQSKEETTPLLRPSIPRLVNLNPLTPEGALERTTNNDIPMGKQYKYRRQMVKT